MKYDDNCLSEREEHIIEADGIANRIIAILAEDRQRHPRVIMTAMTVAFASAIVGYESYTESDELQTILEIVSQRVRAMRQDRAKQGNKQ